MTQQVAAATTANDGGAGAGRALRRRRNLPGGRAVVGAFLVTLAAVGIFMAWLQTNAAPTSQYATAARDLLAGEVLEAQDLALVAIDLPPEQQRLTVASAEGMVGRVVLSPMTQGELFGVGDTADGADIPGTSSLTVPIETNRALAGQLEPGDRVDVIATWEDTSRFVATDLAVVDAVIDGTSTAVTLAPQDPQMALAIANAIDTAEVFLARTNPTGDVSLAVPVTPDADNDVAGADGGPGTPEPTDEGGS